MPLLRPLSSQCPACTIGLCRAVVVEPAGFVTFTSRNVQHWGAGALGLTFIANVWSVVLVALRFRFVNSSVLMNQLIVGVPLLRTYQKEVAGNLPSKASSGWSPMVILLFLVETGTLYCCTLVSTQGSRHYDSDKADKFGLYL